MVVSAGNTRRDRSRALILEAARTVFNETGYEAAQMAHLAARAGLTRKTVYNLFGSKEGVLDRLLEQAEAASEPLYRHRLDAGEPARDLLQSILLDSAGWCLANPRIAPFALAPRARPARAPSEQRPSFQRIVRDTVLLGQRQGVFRCDENADFMAALVLAVYGQLMLSVLSQSSYAVEDIPRCLRLVVEGIGSPVATAP
jgi:TetR/AcrR family transcriptional regulator, regulator of autoinduction and epiphytic fitness